MGRDIILVRPKVGFDWYAIRDTASSHFALKDGDFA